MYQGYSIVSSGGSFESFPRKEIWKPNPNQRILQINNEREREREREK
jgi:hypothetical protein